MVGRQFLGRIDSRLQQAKPDTNVLREYLGGVSFVGVGDMAQCEAINDQQPYDLDKHKESNEDIPAQKVVLSNQGLDIYSTFDYVVRLTHCHRINIIKEPKNESEVEYNTRANLFLDFLHRLRDLKITDDDYAWICRRKKSFLSVSEKASFDGAPVLMDYRRISEANPEDNCNYYNRMQLRNFARKHKKPILSFKAVHEGVSQEKGLEMDDLHFNNLASELEICVGARIIITANLAIEHGLMNGTQGTVVAILYFGDAHPMHDNYELRMPSFIVVDCPKYAGPAFFDGSEKQTWIPIRPHRVQDNSQTRIARIQFPFVLGWALTPWKAQGMTLDKVVCKVGKAAASPGVLFVALSRVRHPDDLMLDDEFPAYSTIMEQMQSESFKKRVHWERLANLKFSRTIRHFMRDATLYSAGNVWTETMSKGANVLLGELRKNVLLSKDDMVRVLEKSNLELDAGLLVEKMHSFPHIFEIAHARGELDSLDLDGTLQDEVPSHKRLKYLVYKRWKVSVGDILDFVTSARFSFAVLELLAHVLRPQLPDCVTVYSLHASQALNRVKMSLREDSYHCFFPRKYEA